MPGMRQPVVALMLSALVGVASVVASSSDTARSFVIQDNEFVKDGELFHVKAGCIHYSRVPVEYWRDRLLRLKAMGLNGIQTYVPWNWHEGTKGTFDFDSGARNLTQFLALAQELDLVVVLRAGPYMCGEWEFGGLPAWLFENGSIPLRTYSQPYLGFAQRYWTEGLFPVVKPMMYENGGPVIMVQVENEYGSYGDVSTNPSDAQYLHALIATARESLGNSTLLFTTDGGDTGYMTRGSFKGDEIYTVGDGCGNPQTCIDAQRAFNAPGMSPFFCSECYTGWLTHWGEGGANTSTSAPHVDSILGLNGSVSLYMGALRPEGVLRSAIC
jgi:beta-galactosidase